MPQQFRHLQYEERCQIQALHQQGFSVTAIAAQLQRHKSTVCRELQRNAGPSGYHHEQAQQLARDRRHRAVTGPGQLQPAIWNLISDRLQRHWSPEQVAGSLKPVGAVSVSFSWLYQRIRQDRAQGGSLYTYLRQRGKPRRCKASPGQRRPQGPQRTPRDRRLEAALRGLGGRHNHRQGPSRSRRHASGTEVEGQACSDG